jgi:parallel beta-helix repeat protein
LPVTWDVSRNHYTYIQEAIDAASAGDTINVAAGEYAGAIVNKNVKLVGEADGSSVITSGVPFKETSSTYYTAFRPEADGCEIRNFTINCDTAVDLDLAIYAIEVNDVTIDSLTINDNGTIQGITNWNGSNWVITHNVISKTVASGGGGIGIFVGAKAQQQCTGNLVQYNEINATATAETYSCPGILVCLDLRSGGYDAKDGTEDVSGNQILDNTITASGANNGVGIEVGSILPDYEEGTIAAIMAAAAVHDNIVSGNSIDGAYEGFYLYNATNTIFTGNGLANSVNNGIYVEYAENGTTITGNTFSNNAVQLQDDARTLDIAGIFASNTFDRSVTVDHPTSSLLHTIWSSIQDGIDNALADDTVYVGPGTYNLTSPIAVDKSLTITGDTANPSNVTVNAATIAGDDRDCFQVKANNVTIQGFTMSGAYDADSGAQNAGIVIGTHWTGAAIIGLDNITISNNEIYDCTRGIYVYRATNVTISDNKIHDTVIAGAQAPTVWPGKAIELRGDGDPTEPQCNHIDILGNEIYNCQLLGIEVNLWEMEPDEPFVDVDVLIDGNTIYNNGGNWVGVGYPDTYVYRGISCNGQTTNVTITNNEIYGHDSETNTPHASSAGIRIDDEKEHTITGNYIHDNYKGIRISEDEYSDLSGFVVNSNNFENNTVQVDDSAEALNMETVLASNTFDRSVTVDHPGDSLLHTIWSKIQDAIDATVAGDTVFVAAGTYTEAVTVAPGSDLIIQGAGRDVTTWIAPADDVSRMHCIKCALDGYVDTTTLDISGFTFSVEDNAISQSGIAIYINKARNGPLYLDVHDNKFVETTTIADETANSMLLCHDRFAARVGGVAPVNIYNNLDYTTGGIAISNSQAFDIYNNTFDGSSDALYIGYGCPTNTTIGDHHIYNNTFLNASNDYPDGPWPSIYFNYTGSGTGMTFLPSTIENNIFEDNDVAVGYSMESNITYPADVIQFNSFDNNTEALKVFGAHATTVNAEKNWWGTAVMSEVQALVSDNVDYSPWLGATVGTTPMTWYTNDSIQDVINTAAAGDTINVAAGTYVEAIAIDKSLTLLGATWDVNKNGYTVPADYAWDDTVESIIMHPDPAGGYISIVDIEDVDNVTFEGFVVQELNAEANLNSSLIRVRAQTQEISNIIVRNNVIGPNTNVVSQDGTHGRMGLYLVNNPYSDQFGIVNSTFSGNKIFGCEGNGNNVFIWSSYKGYGAAGPASMAGTVIEDNEIYGAHRSGIETAGGFSDLIIRNNSIYGNYKLPGDTPDLKYGNGIVMIRGSSDRENVDGYGPVNVTLEDNNIHDNDGHGIYMGPNNQGVTFTGNDVQNNGQDGIIVDLIGNYHNPDFETSTGPFTNLAGSQDVAGSFNNIYDNAGLGVRVVGEPTNDFVFDATNNWWGTKSEAVIATKVSDHVDYEPYIGADVTKTKSKKTEAGDDNVDAKDEANTEVEKKGTGTPTVTVAKYKDNPGAGFSGDTGSYVDVHLDDIEDVEEITIKLYYTEAEIAGVIESSLRLRWWDGTDWIVCSDSGVNTADIPGPPAYAGYMWAKIRADTIPNLTQMSGTVFGGGGETSEPEPAPIPGPGAIGGVPGADKSYLIVDMLGKRTQVEINESTNTTVEELLAYDEEGMHLLELQAETLIKCGDCEGGNCYPEIIVMSLSDETIEPPEGMTLVGPIYDFTGYTDIHQETACDLATYFDPMATVLLNYDPELLPLGASEPVIGFYSHTDNNWVLLTPDIGRVAEVGTATGVTGYFASPFAVLASTTPTEETPEPPPSNLSPAHFVASGLSITPAEVKTGEAVTISLNVANDGEESGTYTAELQINGSTVDSKVVTLDGGQSQSVSFAVTSSEAGTYDASVAGLNGSFTVVKSSIWWIYLIIAAVVIILGVVALSLRRGRG